MNSAVVFSLLMLAFLGAIMLLLPHFSPRRFLFAITVPLGFRESGPGLAALRRYEWEVAAAILVTAAAAMALAQWSPEVAFVVAAMAPIAGGLAAFLRERSQVRRQAPRVADVREAELSAEGDHLPRWFLLAIPAFAAPGAFALYLRAHWDEIPARIPMRYGFNGPDRWADKSPQAVYAPLLFSTGLMLLLLLLMLAAFYGSRRTPQRGAILKLVLGALYLFALPFGGAGFNPLFQIPPVWHFIPPLVLVSAAIAWALRIASDPSNSGEATPDDCWYLGAIYYNPHDPAVFVQKRMGFGFTVNFGNRWAWIVLGGFVAGMMALVLVFPRGH